ncbi:MAG: hypothetical protein AAB131_15375, partial [Actinomycetota bacterium]
PSTAAGGAAVDGTVACPTDESGALDEEGTVAAPPVGVGTSLPAERGRDPDAYTAEMPPATTTSEPAVPISSRRRDISGTRAAA